MQEEPGASDNEIVCSGGWIDRFKRRYDIKSGKMHGELASVSLEFTYSGLLQFGQLLSESTDSVISSMEMKQVYFLK